MALVTHDGYSARMATVRGHSDGSGSDGFGRHVELQLEEEEDDGARFEVHDDAVDAHRQVLEMSSTIEILTRDFENLQRELLEAYRKLHEYSEQDPRLHLANRSQLSPTKVETTLHGGIVSNAMAKLRTGGNHGDCDCNHAMQVNELRQIIAVKDNALTEALHERSEYKIRLEQTESILREMQCGRSRSGLHIQTSSRPGSFASASVPCGMSSTSPVHFTPSVSTIPSSSSGRDVPKHERFDQESSYQTKEADELFWRRQYRDAVRMRKHHGQPAGGLSRSMSHDGIAAGNPKPSLKIFSYPNANRQKGITDENVPFTRYIGISTRQNEIIKEQHRLLS